MAWTQTDIDNLKTAIATGARTVAVDGKTVTYNSFSDMLRALRLMRAEVSGTTPNAVRRVEFRRVGGGST